MAQTAREMAESGDWIHPTFAGAPRLQKPPLAYWTTAVAFWLTGRVDEASARLPNALAAVALVGLVTIVGGRWFGRRVGISAGLIQATSLWTVVYGKSALVDMTLSLLVAIAILMSAADRLSGKQCSIGAPILGFWFINGLIVLAKGPVGLGFVLPTMLLYRYLRRKERRPTDMPFVRSLWHLPGMLVFLVLAGWWPVAVGLDHPNAWTLWMEQSVGRFATHFGPQTRPWYYYLYQVLLLTLPWTPLWLVALRWHASGVSRQNEGTEDWEQERVRVKASSLDSRPRGNDGEKGVKGGAEYWLLWTWFAVGLVFLSLSAGKREHYILPALAPLAIFAAIGWERMSIGWRKQWRVGVATFAISFVVAATMVVEGIVLPMTDKMTAVREMLDRQTDVIRDAEFLLQFASGDNATEFFTPKPIQRTSDIATIRERLQKSASILVIGPEASVESLADLGCLAILDRATRPIRFVRSDEDFVLARLSYSADDLR